MHKGIALLGCGEGETGVVRVRHDPQFFGPCLLFLLTVEVAALKDISRHEGAQLHGQRIAGAQACVEGGRADFYGQPGDPLGQELFQRLDLVVGGEVRRLEQGVVVRLEVVDQRGLRQRDHLIAVQTHIAQTFEMRCFVLIAGNRFGIQVTAIADHRPAVLKPIEQN